LWKGDEALPTYEDIHTAKALQLRADQEDDISKEIGGLGDAQSVAHTRGWQRPGDPKLTGIQLISDGICHAYLRAVQQATGQVRLYDNELAHGRRLALDGWDKEAVYETTLAVADERLKRRAGVPSLYDVAVELSARNLSK